MQDEVLNNEAVTETNSDIPAAVENPSEEPVAINDNAEPAQESEGAIAAETGLIEPTAPVAEELAPAVASIDPQAEAIKAGMIATGDYHLGRIYQEKVINTHGKTANLIAKIIREAHRVESWTHDEIIAIWDRVESELFGAK